MIDDFRQIRHVTILGVGLIGGSLGLALKAKGFQGKITGLGRRMSTLNHALRRKAIDVATTDFEEGLCEAELAVICTPVDLIPAMAQSIAESVPDTKPLVITDVGSVKGQIVKSIEQFFAAKKHNHLRFVGSHPMAGSHRSGVDAARVDLFEGAKCIVTPVDETDLRALQLVADLWKFAGAELHQLPPDEHDILIAGASHLPHLIASILTNTVGELRSNSAEALDFAATGFRDTTRIAAGSPEIWTGIFMQNASALMQMVDILSEKFTQFKTLLENRNANGITQILVRAKNLRESLEER
ncbi:MAG: prephenate dehydrogenase [Candidatus Poribacteria bacterium]